MDYLFTTTLTAPSNSGHTGFVICYHMSCYGSMKSAPSSSMVQMARGCMCLPEDPRGPWSRNSGGRADGAVCGRLGGFGSLGEILCGKGRMLWSESPSWLRLTPWLSTKLHQNKSWTKETHCCKVAYFYLPLSVHVMSSSPPHTYTLVCSTHSSRKAA